MIEEKDLEEIKKQINEIIKSEINSNLIKVNEDIAKIRKTKQKENRFKIDKILKSLPELERFVNSKMINTDNTEEIFDKVKTKTMLSEIYKILDNYLENEKSDLKEDRLDDSLEIKKKILRCLYGYKPQIDEVVEKTRIDLAEKMYTTDRTIYKYQCNLLDDLAPCFFGIDGLVL